MDQENQNATGDAAEINPLIKTHTEFMDAVDLAAKNAGATVLMAVYYQDAKQTAIEYIGTPDAVVEHGMRAILTKN